VLIFLIWNWSDLGPALEHVILSARTEDDQKLAVDAIERMSATLLPFGRISSNLMLVSFIGFLVFWLINFLELQSYDWDRNIKDLKAKRKKKLKKLEAEIESLKLLSEKVAIISGAAKDLEILADKIERIKLEIDTPKKAKAEKTLAPVKKTAELFTHKPNGKQGPPKLATRERPEF